MDHVADEEIILAQLIRTNGRLDAFSEYSKVSMALIYSFVDAENLTKMHVLQISQDELALTFEYKIPYVQNLVTQ
jgi:hypothetical protein